MANHAHITPDAAFKSNPTQQTAGARSVDQAFKTPIVADISRRTALCALPAISGVALLTATAHAVPVFVLDQAIERLEAAKVALKSCEEQALRFNDLIPPFACVVVGKNQRGEEIRAYSEHEIQIYMGKAAAFWGPGSPSQQRLNAKIAEFQEARSARLKAERDSGLTASLDRLEAICIEHDSAFDALIGLSPATLDEARRKLMVLAGPLAQRLADCDETEASEILHSLL